MTDRKLLVVLGMHRSGTSALTRGLAALGVYLGENLMPASINDNDKGFWEDLDVFRLNEDILKKLGTSWSSLYPQNTDACAGVDFMSERLRAAHHLDAMFSHSNVCGFKDPRTAILMPFWKTVFEDLEIEPTYVIAVRNPLEIVESLRSRNNVDSARTLHLWARYLFSAIEETALANRVFVEFGSLLSEPARELERIAAVAELSVTEILTSEIKEFALGFLDQKLKRHSVSSNELARNRDVPPQFVELYKYLSEWSRAEREAQVSLPEDLRLNLAAYFDQTRLLSGCADRSESNIQASRAEIDSRNRELRAASEELAEFRLSAEERLKEAASKIEQQAAKLQSTEHQNTEHLAAINALQGSSEELKAQLSVASEKVASLTAEAELRRGEMEEMTVERSGLLAKIDEQMGAFDKLRGRTTTLEREVETLRGTLHAVENEKLELLAQVDEQKGAIETYRGTLQAVENEKLELLAQVDEQKGAIETYRGTLQAVENEKLELLAKVDEQSQIILDFGGQVSTLEDILQTRQRQIQEGEAERVELQAHLVRERQVVQEGRRRIDEVIEESRDKFLTYETECGWLQLELANLQKEKLALEGQLVQVQNRLLEAAEAKQRIAFDRDQSARASNLEVAKLVQEISEVETQMIALEEENAVISKKLANASEVIAGLETKMSDREALSEHNDRMQEQLRARASEVAALQEKYRLSRAEVFALRTSHSWKITAPLRGVVNSLSKLLKSVPNPTERKLEEG